MPILKMKMPNSGGKRRIIASTGGIGVKTGGGASYPRSDTAYYPVTKYAQYAGSGASVTMTQPMFFSPLHTPQNWQIASKRREIYQWARFYYENEPKVAAGVDFYANFPMNGFKLECKDSKVLEYFEEVVERLELDEWMNYISHEYHLLGEAWPFLEIACPVCHGSGINPDDGETCLHSGGTIKSIRVLNPDYIEVQSNVLADEPVIALLPDEELKMIIQRKQPKQIYDKLPNWLKQLIASGNPIPLSNRSVSHIKYNASPYGTYGTSMIRRLFTILAYKTKIMTAVWIVAERLILPVRVVKLGDKDRPATEDDIQDVINQLSAVANDPNLTIVTHHAFDYEWYGASGKIYQINHDLEYIGKEILDGLMLNQAILNGEMAGYNSAQVGVEILLRRMENWRNKLKKWVEKKIFLPIAMMQGFIDKDKSKRLKKNVYLYPRMKFNDMGIRDNSNKIQIMLQMYDKGMVSSQTILSEMGLDYDTETEKRRQENVIASASGQMPGGGGPGGAGPMGGPMGGGGGMPPGGAPPPMAGDMGGGAPGAPGAGGAPPGGGAMAPGMMPMGGAQASAPPMKIMKKGKGAKNEDQVQTPPNKILKLTKLEATMYEQIRNLKVPYRLFGQYEIPMPGEPQPFVLDFAFPEIGVGIETDGEIWHERADLKEKDRERDQKLANVGWRIIRFSEEAVYEHANVVQDIIRKNIVDAARSIKKRSDDWEAGLQKTAGTQEDLVAETQYIETEDSLLGCVFALPEPNVQSE